jgi:hypothetical protein
MDRRIPVNTLTLQDVADLAKVRRPVVSMWRKRPIVRGVSMPFPDPVKIVDGVARFDRDDVVDWLTRTGRGNNAEHSYDAPAIAVPDGAALEDVVTLLCWHVLTGEELSGTSLAHRARRAKQFDPDDMLLLREIRGLPVSEAVLTYVDELVEASFGAPDALQRLEQGRLKRALAVRDRQRGNCSGGLSRPSLRTSPRNPLCCAPTIHHSCSISQPSVSLALYPPTERFAGER